ncbi:hypothetical protein [Streptomyces sp. SCL15-6]|uniref:tetratricopeptide repeat protein n=1 Tax=Streptomyces sp. SCL15-6 TaxID=2967222 RepID=UPI00296759FE|nr:hypothetical protein [Streptomyces sp. SCL15-6]
MSGDEKPGVRRPRSISEPGWLPGARGVLHNRLYRVYQEAGKPSVQEMADLVRADHSLPGAPGKDTIHRCLRGVSLPTQADVVALARVLARAARWDEQHFADEVIGLWTDAELMELAGRPIREYGDPFALQVHEVIDSDSGESSLPLYVEREHDWKLRQLVTAAVSGHSAMVLLKGESSAGKTRACWEAIQALPEDWRLWHPLHTQEALDDLNLVVPKTVVWLDEADAYFLTPGSPLGQLLAAELRKLLRFRDRSPVLVLGTIWPENLGALKAFRDRDASADSYEQTRKLFSGRALRGDVRRGPSDMPTQVDVVIDVPDDFSAPGLMQRVRQAAKTDRRWAEALDKAEEGRLTQYLAGGPGVVRRYAEAPAAARALIHAAMDLRRLGHGPVLPHALLQAALKGYLKGIQFDSLTEEALEHAWEYVSNPVPCRGARPPLGKVRQTSLDAEAARPAYRLSDFLDHDSRFKRQDTPVPAALWHAAVQHGDRTALIPLANAAQTKHEYLHAFQLYAAAVEHGETAALYKIRDLPRRDVWIDEGLSWLRRRAEAGDESAQNAAIRLMVAEGRSKEAWHWTASMPQAQEPGALRRSVRLLHEAGLFDEDGFNRISSLAAQGDVEALAEEADALWRRGKIDQALLIHKELAELGDAVSLRLYVTGLLESGRNGEAVQWLKHRSEMGDLDALSAFVEIMQKLGEVGEMLHWLHVRVVAGDVAALTEAIEYFDEAGLGQEKLIWYQEAAAAGHSSALMSVADQLARRGRMLEALDWYRSAAMATGNKIAMRKAGRILEEQGESAEAAAWLSRAATAPRIPQQGTSGSKKV